MTRLPISPDTSAADAVETVRQWIDAEVPAVWRSAAFQGPAALRAVRTAADYRDWYPAFADSGLVAPTWLPEHGGLGVGNDIARAIETILAPLRLKRLNPLGLNNAAAALFSHGTEEQRLRFLPPIVRNEEKWCQLFSEPGAGSDLASLATRAVRDGDHWVISGQKVWTTWADEADFAILLARTDPDQPKHKGITYFLLDMHQPGVDVRPLRQITGEAEFNDVFLDGARVPDEHRVGEINDGWRVSASTLSSHIAMASDFCVAADDARFWEPFMARGFTPDSGAAWLLPRLIGMVRTRQLLMLGEEISGATAADWGIIHAACMPDQLASAADELVTKLAEAPTVALGLTKWLLHSGNGLDLDRHLQNEAMALELSSRSDDFKEGLAAFRDKRDAKFQGR